MKVDTAAEISNMENVQLMKVVIAALLDCATDENAEKFLPIFLSSFARTTSRLRLSKILTRIRRCSIRYGRF